MSEDDTEIGLEDVCGVKMATGETCRRKKGKCFYHSNEKKTSKKNSRHSTLPEKGKRNKKTSPKIKISLVEEEQTDVKTSSNL